MTLQDRRGRRLITHGVLSARAWFSALRHPAPPWNDGAVIRADLFGAERLEYHAISLAQAQPVIGRAARVPPLSKRVQENATVLLSAHRSCTQASQAGLTVTPATEWLLDNYHLVEKQLRQIKRDLPSGYYRQLPKLSTGPFTGYPRVLGIAWAFVAHTDSLMNGSVFARFVRAYQTVDPLTIGELWALAITLRIVLIENMRRVTDQIVAEQNNRQSADDLVDRVMGQAGAGSATVAPDPTFRALAEATQALEGGLCRMPLLRASPSGCAVSMRSKHPCTAG